MGFMIHNNKWMVEQRVVILATKLDNQPIAYWAIDIRNVWYLFLIINFFRFVRIKVKKKRQQYIYGLYIDNHWIA